MVSTTDNCSRFSYIAVTITDDVVENMIKPTIAAELFKRPRIEQ